MEFQKFTLEVQKMHFKNRKVQYCNSFQLIQEMHFQLMQGASL